MSKSEAVTLNAAEFNLSCDSSYTYLSSELRRCDGELSGIIARLQKHSIFSQEKDLNYYPEISESLVLHIGGIRRLIKIELDRIGHDTATSEHLRLEAFLRWILHSVAYFKSSLEWKAPAYAQARLNQFFDIRAQGNTGVNYDRYESPDVMELEERLGSVLGINPSTETLLACSSGMGAYNLIESFLIRYSLRNSNRVVLPPYLYFECTEQLLALPGLEIRMARSFDAEEIADLVFRHDAQVFFADPIANDLAQRKVDLPRLIELVRAQTKTQRTLVIDGTMTSGCLDPELLKSDRRLNIFYYEGCNKYIQYGLDLHMAGLTVFPLELKETFVKLRRNCGVNLPRPAAQSFPSITRATHLDRMQAIEETARFITTQLQSRLKAEDRMRVICSAHDSHPDFEISSHLSFNGGCVTFEIFDKERAKRDNINQFIKVVLEESQRKGVYLSKGVSFGFSFPRISAAAAMAGTIDPFLRLYVGHPPREQVEKLIEVLVGCFREYLGCPTDT